MDIKPVQNDQHDHPRNNDEPADTAGRVEEPVHEDSSAVVVWIVSKQTVPLVLLKILSGYSEGDGDGDGASENIIGL